MVREVEGSGMEGGVEVIEEIVCFGFSVWG